MSLKELSEKLYPSFIESFGSAKPCILFLSASTLKDRAVVRHATHNTPEQAWSAVMTLLEKIFVDKEQPSILRADWVTSSVNITWADYLEKLKARKRGLLRQGIALDKDYKMAFLEQELNANSIVYASGSAATKYEFQSKKATAYCSQRFGRGFPKINRKDKIILFNTSAIFIQDGMAEPLKLIVKGDVAERRELNQEKPELFINMAKAASKYLVAQCKDDGLFVYGFYPCNNEVIAGYNVHHHLGTLFAMAEVYAVSEDGDGKAALGKAIEHGLEYAINNYIVYRKTPDDENIAYFNDGKRTTVGMRGLALLALSKWTTATGTKKYIPLMNSIARSIFSVQKADGTFIHALNIKDFSVQKNSAVSFYDGEAIYGLLSLYAITKDNALLESCERSLNHFIETDHCEHYDHWLAYAVNDFTVYRPEEKYFKLGLNNMLSYMPKMINDFANSPTSLEMMSATMKMIKRMKSLPEMKTLLERVDEKEFYSTVKFCAEQLIDAYFFPEVAMYFKTPEHILNSFFVRDDSFRVRIDDVQHNISSFLAYASYLKDVQAVEEVPPPDKDVQVVEEVPPPDKDVQVVEEVPPTVEDVQAVEEVPPPIEDVQAVEEVPPTVKDVQSVEEVPPPIEDVQAVEEVPPTVKDVQSVEEVPPPIEDVQSVEEVPPPIEDVQPVEEVPPTVKDVQAVEEVSPTIEDVQAVEEVPLTVEDVQAVEEVPPTVEDVQAVEEVPPTIEDAQAVEEVPPTIEDAQAKRIDRREIQIGSVRIIIEAEQMEPGRSQVVAGDNPPLQVGIMKKTNNNFWEMSNPLYPMFCMAKHFNIELLLFEPEDIDFKNKTVKALTLENNSKVRKVSPLPRIIDNDKIYFHSETADLMEQLKKYSCLVRPASGIDKQFFYETLSNDGRFREFLIETHAVNEFNQLLSLLDKYHDDVILKSATSSDGKNMARIRFDNDNYVANLNDETIILKSVESLLKFYEENFSQKNYFLQPYCISRTLQGNPFTIRLNTRRGAEGKFKVFPYPQIGSQKDFLPVRSYTIDFEDFLRIEFGKDWKTLRDRLIDLGCKFPEYYQSFFSDTIFDMGIDICIYKHGNTYDLKIFEAYIQPDFADFRNEIAVTNFEYYRYLDQKLKDGSLK